MIRTKSTKQSRVTSQEGRSFFDLSSGEKIKILRAAGRNAQKEQQKLLKAYEARFGRVA